MIYYLQNKFLVLFVIYGSQIVSDSEKYDDTYNISNRIKSWIEKHTNNLENKCKSFLPQHVNCETDLLLDAKALRIKEQYFHMKHFNP